MHTGTWVYLYKRAQFYGQIQYRHGWFMERLFVWGTLPAGLTRCQPAHGPYIEAHSTHSVPQHTSS